MDRLRREKDAHILNEYGLVKPLHSNARSNDVSHTNDDDDAFWDDKLEEKNRVPKNVSAAERQSQMVATSLTQLLSVSFQEKAQSLQRSELDAFLLATLRESPSFRSAAPSDLESAVGYLKQVLGTLHGLDVSPSPEAHRDQGSPSAAKTEKGEISITEMGLSIGTATHGSHSPEPQAVPPSPSRSQTGELSSKLFPTQAFRQQQVDASTSPYGTTPPSHLPMPTNSSSPEQQQQQQLLQGMGHHGRGTHPYHNYPQPGQIGPYNQQQQLDPYTAFLSAAASAATAAAAAFVVGGWPRSGSFSHPSQLPTPLAASSHTSLDQAWPSQHAPQPFHHLSPQPDPPQHLLSSQQPRTLQPPAQHAHSHPRGNKRRSSSKGSGSSSPEPEPQALDARMVPAAIHMMVPGSVSPPTAAHPATALQGHNPYPSSTSVRVIKLDEGPRITARSAPSAPSELLTPHFQVFHDLQPPPEGAQQPLPLKQQDLLPPPSPYISPPASPPRLPLHPSTAARASPHGRISAQLTPTPAPSRARVPAPHHHHNQPRPTAKTPQSSLPTPNIMGPQQPPQLSSPPIHAAISPSQPSPTTHTLPPAPNTSPSHPGYMLRAPAIRNPAPESDPLQQSASQLQQQQAQQQVLHQEVQQHTQQQIQQVPAAEPQPPSTHKLPQPLQLPPRPLPPPRQPVPLPPELQDSVQRTLEFLEDPYSYAPGAVDSKASAYPPRMQYPTAEQTAAEQALEEQLGGRFDYKMLVADLEAMKRRTLKLPSHVSATRTALFTSTHMHHLSTAVSSAQALTLQPEGSSKGTTDLAAAARSAANAEARGGGALGKLVARHAAVGAANSKAGPAAQPSALQQASAHRSGAALPAAGHAGDADIVEALPPANSVWDSEEAWNNLGAYVQSLQQEIAYRASTPAPAPFKHAPTPQELDAAVAARLHRPHPSAARAAAASKDAPHNAVGSQSGQKARRGGGVSGSEQQQRLQIQQQQQVEDEGGPNPPNRPRAPAQKIAFGRRVEGAPNAPRGSNLLKSPEDFNQPNQPLQGSAKAPPSHLTRAGAAGVAARHATHSTPHHSTPHHIQPDPTSRMSTASKLSALLRAHAQYAQQHRTHAGSPSRHASRQPPHTFVHGRQHRQHQRQHQRSRNRRAVSDSGSPLCSSSESASSLCAESQGGSGSGSSSGGGAELEDVLSLLASVLAEEDRVEAKEALMEEVLEALQAGGDSGLEGPGGRPADVAYNVNHKVAANEGGDRPKHGRLSDLHAQQQPMSGWSVTQELAQQLADLAPEQQQQREGRNAPERKGSAGPSHAMPGLGNIPGTAPVPTVVPRFITVRDLHTPLSSDPSHFPNQPQQEPRQQQQHLREQQRLQTITRQQQQGAVQTHRLVTHPQLYPPMLHASSHHHTSSQSQPQQQQQQQQFVFAQTHTQQEHYGPHPHQDSQQVTHTGALLPSTEPWQASTAPHSQAGHTGEADPEEDADHGGAAAEVSATMPAPYARSAAMLGLYGDAAQLGATGHAPAHAGAATHLLGPGLGAALGHELGQSVGSERDMSSAEALLGLVVEEVAAQVVLRERLQGPCAAPQYPLQQEGTMRTMPLLMDPQLSQQLASEVVMEHLRKVLAPISTNFPPAFEEPLPASAPILDQLHAPTSKHTAMDPGPGFQAKPDTSTGPDAASTPLPVAFTQPTVVQVSGSRIGGGRLNEKSSQPVPDSALHDDSSTGHGGDSVSGKAGVPDAETDGHWGRCTGSLEAAGIEAREAGRAALLAAAAAAAAALPSPPKHYKLQGLGRPDQDQQVQGSGPLPVQGSAPQQAQGFGSQQAQGLKPQQAQGSAPQQVQGFAPQQAQGPEPQQVRGFVPHQVQGSAPQQAQGFEPQQAQGSGPQQAQGPEPQQAQDSASLRAQGPEPQQAQGSEPQQAQDSGPQQVQGSEPQQVQGSVPQQVQGSVPQQAQDSAPQQAQGSALRQVQGFEPQQTQGSAPQQAQGPEPQQGAAEQGNVQQQRQGQQQVQGHDQWPLVHNQDQGQPQQYQHTLAAGHSHILTMQVPVPIPTPYPAYYQPPPPAYMQQGIPPFTPQQHSYYLGGKSVAHPSQPGSSPLLHPTLGHLQQQQSSGVHYQEPPQQHFQPSYQHSSGFNYQQPAHQQPPPYQPQLRHRQVPHQPHHQHQWGMMDTPAKRSRLSSLLPGLERVLLNSSDLGSSGDSDALEDAVHAALHARAHIDASERQHEGSDEGQDRLMRGSYPEASLEALIARVPRAEHGGQQQQLQQGQAVLESGRDQQNDAKQQQRSEGVRQSSSNARSAHGVLEQVRVQAGAEASASASKEAADSSSSEASKVSSVQAVSSMMQVPAGGASEGHTKGLSRGSGSEGLDSSSELGMEAAKLAKAGAGGEGEKSSDQQTSGDSWGQRMKEEEEGPAGSSGQRLTQQQEGGAEQSKGQDSCPVVEHDKQQHGQGASARNSMQQRLLEQPQGLEADGSGNQQQTLDGSSSSQNLQQQQQFQQHHEAFAQQGLMSMEWPSGRSGLSAPTISTTASPLKQQPQPSSLSAAASLTQPTQPSSTINQPPPSGQAYAASGAPIGLPPSLHHYNGPIRRLWRPASDAEPPGTQPDPQGASMSGNRTDTVSDSADAKRLGLPPLHTSSPPLSLYSSSEARFSLDATTTDATTSSSSTQEGLFAREPPRSTNLAQHEGREAGPGPQQQLPHALVTKPGASYRVMRHYGARRRALMQQLNLVGDSLLASSRSMHDSDSNSTGSSKGEDSRSEAEDQVQQQWS